MRKRRLIPCPLETRSILWEGANILKLVRELQDFLKTRMKQVSDPTFGTCWICSVCDWSKDYKCWGKTVEFCEKKNLDWNTFVEILNSFSGFVYDIECDADVLNRLPIREESENIPKADESKDQVKKE